MRTRLGLLSSALALAAAATLGSGGATAATLPSQAPPQATLGGHHDSGSAHGHLLGRDLGSRPKARQALARAHQAFAHPDKTAPDGGSANAGHDATMVLRDLSLRAGTLHGAARARAEQILARPTDAGTDGDGIGVKYHGHEATPVCSEHVCVHYVASGPSASTQAQVQLTDTVFEHVWSTEVDQMGYLPPRSDLSSPDHGPDGRLDVYLAEIGDKGYYGYCTSDDPARRTHHAVSAYCVVDNDFSAEEFPGDPLTSLRVTAAHEFFHAVQFSYDWVEDRWFMETTATWMESQVYPGLHDNLQFLESGPLGHPGISLDYFDPVRDDPGYYAQYGGWIWWTFLAEQLGTHAHPDGSIVHDIWNRAANTPGAPGDYSLTAMRSALHHRDLDFTALFAKFGAVDRFAHRWYALGHRYPNAPLAHRFRLSKRHPSTKTVKATMYHLGSLTVRFTPGTSLRGHHRLRVHVNLPASRRGSAATLVVHARNGHIWLRPVTLDKHGNGDRTVNFTRSRTRFIELTLTDASTRMDCTPPTDSWLSCDGTPRDDGLTYAFSAKATG
ncbi:MAG TPA: MXAN_6640 family putative metalloprotease [Nocardioidaceae bacterium]|nr:MXAN_6640 family putative metalloprotease [Nocardioidaceae bacterium]